MAIVGRAFYIYIRNYGCRRWCTRLIPGFIMSILLSGCSIIPGMHISESSLTKPVLSQGQKKEDLKVTTINGQLIQQLRQREQRRSALPTAMTQETKDYLYHIGPRDILSVTVWDHPELTIPAGEFRSAESVGHVVNSEGNIFFPHVGVIEVSGKTLDQVRDLLTARLAKYIVKPQLDVRVVSYRSQKVYVTGEFLKPGLLPITDVPMTILDAVNLAGGMTEKAAPRYASLTRNGKTYPIDIQALYQGGDISQNILLQNDDLLNLPDHFESKVFVLGEVRKPASYQMQKNGMTLADAIGDSAGFDPLTSDPSRVYVIRGELNEPKIYRLDARSPDAILLASQFSLQPRDVIYVASADIARWNRVISQILPTVQTLWQTNALVKQ